jgi:proteasome assembly chaperone (PAC2) family protein
MALKQLDLVQPRAPILIACWPGMGHVGIQAATYLRRKLNAILYAEIDATPYFQPEALDVSHGIGRVLPAPAQRLYYVKEPPVIIFEAETQLSGSTGLRSAGELLDAVQPAGVEAIYTGAAFAMQMSVRQRSKVYGVATDERMKGTFAGLQVEPLGEGRVSGLNGLLLGLAASRNVAAACFLATMPQYALETPNPKASKALIQVFQRILNTTVDMTEIDQEIRESDRMMGEFESRVAAAIEALRSQTEAKERTGQAEGEDEGSDRPEPHQLMEHIERLFEEAQRDRDKARLLKEELDRWGLFKLYEDRFLDLFDRTKNGK